jgi:hypothetical protein
LSKLAVVTGAIDPVDKARFEILNDRNSGEIDLSKNYVEGCTSDEIKELTRGLRGNFSKIKPP